MGENKSNPDEESIIFNPEYTISICDETGEEIECDVLKEFEVDSQTYVALSPSEDEIIENIWFYRIVKDAFGEEDIDNIETDEEYDRVQAKFHELLEIPEEM